MKVRCSPAAVKTIPEFRNLLSAKVVFNDQIFPQALEGKPPPATAAAWAAFLRDTNRLVVDRLLLSGECDRRAIRDEFFGKRDRNIVRIFRDLRNA